MIGFRWRMFAGGVWALALLLSGASAAFAETPFATESGPTSVPYGWVDFCNRYAGECDGPVLAPMDVTLNTATFHMIEHVNRSVNAKITPTTDMDHWGVIDRWDYPLDGKGDCEDYALLKRKLLMAEGLPRQALLITVVKDHAGEGHAVLTVKTAKADYVLDNMTDRVLRWDETGYRFIKRQSQSDVNQWMSLGVPEAGPMFTAR